MEPMGWVDVERPTPAPPAIDRRTEATAGLVFGAIGMVSWFIPLFGLAMGVLGIVFSARGRRSSVPRRAALGLAASSVATAACLVYAAVRIKGNLDGLP